MEAKVSKYTAGPIPPPPPTMYDVTFSGLTEKELGILRGLCSSFSPKRRQTSDKYHAEIAAFRWALDEAFPEAGTLMIKLLEK